MADAALFLRALMDRIPNSDLPALLEQLPEEMQAQFQAVPAASDRPVEAFFLSPKEVLALLHPSWYEELLPHLAEELRPAVKEALAQKEESPLRAFLLTYLVSAWPEKVLPSQKEMKQSPLHFLLKVDEVEIGKLQELIVVYDIVDEVRQIVAKKRLQEVLQRLSPLQQQFLRSLLHRPAKAPVLSLGLLGLLQQDPQRATSMLRQRGLQRFSCALQDESKPFLWYFFHGIDRRVAQELQAAMETPSSVGERAQAKKRLVEAYKFLHVRTKSDGSDN